MIKKKYEDYPLVCSDAIARKIELWLYNKKALSSKKLDEVRKEFRKLLVLAGFPLPYEVFLHSFDEDGRIKGSIKDTTNRFFTISLLHNDPFSFENRRVMINDREVKRYYTYNGANDLILYGREVGSLLFESFEKTSYSAKVVGNHKQINISYTYSSFGPFRYRDIIEVENSVASFLTNEETLSLSLVDFYKKMCELLKNISILYPIKSLDIIFYRDGNITDFLQYQKGEITKLVVTKNGRTSEVKNFDDYRVSSKSSIGTIEVNKTPADLGEEMDEKTLQKKISEELASIQKEVADIVELKHNLPLFNKYPFFN